MDIQVIPLTNLTLAFLPVLAVLALLYRWSLSLRESVYGLSRMLLQLLIIGYFLAFIFGANNAWMILGILSIMVLASSWIALRTTKLPKSKSFSIALASIIIGGGATFLIIILGVLRLDPWYTPQYAIPLAGMIFGGAMNSVSLAGERIETELSRGCAYGEARNIALRTALIPITNSLFAVGLVSLPGMMTGQILSGVDPLIAARYQVMVMCMLFATAGLSAGLYLTFIRSNLEEFIQKEQKA